MGESLKKREKSSFLGLNHYIQVYMATIKIVKHYKLLCLHLVLVTVGLSASNLGKGLYYRYEDVQAWLKDVNAWKKNNKNSIPAIRHIFEVKQDGQKSLKDLLGTRSMATIWGNKQNCFNWIVLFARNPVRFLIPWYEPRVESFVIKLSNNGEEYLSKSQNSVLAEGSILSKDGVKRGKLFYLLYYGLSGFRLLAYGFCVILILGAMHMLSKQGFETLRKDFAVYAVLTTWLGWVVGNFFYLVTYCMPQN